MEYQRITTATLAICTKTSGGYRPTITRGNLDGYGAPEGEQYIEDLPRPTETPEDGKRWARATPTLDGYGWELVEVVAYVPMSVSMAQFREELSKPAYEVDGTPLRAIVQQAVDAAGIVTQDWWSTAANVERENAKVLAMAQALGVSDEVLDSLFTGASLL